MSYTLREKISNTLDKISSSIDYDIYTFEHKPLIEEFIVAHTEGYSRSSVKQAFDEIWDEKNTSCPEKERFMLSEHMARLHEFVSISDNVNDYSRLTKILSREYIKSIIHTIDYMEKSLPLIKETLSSSQESMDS